MMKNKWEKVFLNPFEDFSEQRLLVAGILAFTATVLVSYFGMIVFDGVIQIHLVPTKLSFILFGNLSNLTVLTVGLFAFTKSLYRKTRFIDVLINVLIARIPMLISGLLVVWVGHLLPLKKITREGVSFITTLNQSDMIGIALLSIFLFFFIAYFFYLLVVGVRHSMNSRKMRHGFLIVFLVFILDAVALLLYREFFI